MSIQSSLFEIISEHYFNFKVICFILIQSILTFYGKNYNVFYMLSIFLTSIFLFYYLLPCPDIIPYGLNFQSGWDNDYMITLLLVFIYSVYMSFIPINMYDKKSISKHLIYNTTSYSVLLFCMYYFNTFSNLNIGCLMR